MKKLTIISLVLLLLAACSPNEQAPTPTMAAQAAVPTSPATRAADLAPTWTAVRPEATTPPTATNTRRPTPLPSVTPTLPPPTPTPTPMTFAIIGDYGLAGDGEAAVAALVDSWDPVLILTTGDNNYPDGEAATIDANVGQYYAEYLYPYAGSYPRPAAAPAENRFFPTLGNHDYYSQRGAEPYLDYFTLPGNERYYEFREGPVHFFALNSDFNEPDGVGANSYQAQWLRQAMAASDAPWKIVYMHVPPYSSGHHGSSEWMRWSFADWGADAVIAGHDHHYERLLVDEILYFVNGLGGGAIYELGEPLPGSQYRFTGEHGAMRVRARPEAITFEFITRAGQIIDSHRIER